jgi:hypothetical protein
MSVAIIGCGASGSICLLELIRKGRDPSTITVVDPYFDGGDLGRRWGAVKSNTKWQQIVDSLSQYPSVVAPIAELSKVYGPEDTCLLSDVANLLQHAVRPLLQSVNLQVDTCKKVKKVEAGWSIELATEGELPEVFCHVFLCQGGVEKQLDYELIETVEMEGVYPERATIIEEKYQASGRTNGLYIGLNLNNGEILNDTTK